MPATARGCPAPISGPPSIGRPRPSSTRPSSASPTGTRNGPPVGSTTGAGRDPAHVAERHQQRAPVAEADHLGGHGGAVAAAGDRDQLADLGPQAGGLDHEADQVDDAAAVTLQVGLGDRP